MLDVIITLAITFAVELQLNAGRPGNELTPAKQGVVRVPSGGSAVSGALVRTVIQCALSQLFAGNTKFPVKVAPACSRSVSPQDALFRADCRPELAETVILFPGDGVLASAVFMQLRGNTAGPSLPPNAATSPVWQYRLSGPVEDGGGGGGR